MAEPFIEENESFLRIHTSPHIYAGISTRCGGRSKPPYHLLNLGLHVKDQTETVIQNRKLLAEKVHRPLDRWICAEQVHGNKVKKVGKAEAGKGVFKLEDTVKSVDGLYTKEKEVVLTALFADCVPIYFMAPKHNMIGIAHAGWKGSVSNIVHSMIHTWVNHEKVPKKDIFTVIGPSICKACYQVDDFVIKKVYEALDSQKQNDTKLIESIGNHQYLLNLKELNKQLIIQEGIPTENIEMTTYCTSCDINLFYSFRKEKNKTGRMMGLISLV